MTPPAMFNTSPAPLDKKSRVLGVLVVSLRSALILFTLVAFIVMAANKQSFYYAYTGQYSTTYTEATLKFSSVKSFVALLILDIFVLFDAIVRLVLCLVQLSRTGAFVSSVTTFESLWNFIFDTVLAYAMIAAVGAAADAQYLLADDDYCYAVPGFCRRAQASIVMSFFAFAILAVSAALYPVRLLRLSK